MRIQLAADRATLTGMPPSGNGNFRVGQVLWKDVASDGTLEVLGSDGAYYPSRLTLEGPDRLHIDVDRDNSPGKRPDLGAGGALHRRGLGPPDRRAAGQRRAPGPGPGQ